MKVYLKDIIERFPEFEIRNYNENAYFEGFSHDSRSVKENDIYIPIIGEKFDGHDFIVDALNNGASMAICQDRKYADLEGVTKPIILVNTIEEGLQKILNYAISPITAPVVAITGSTGKTTTKKMLVTILKNQMEVLYSDTSNTVWGNAVLLSQYKGEDAIVLECGMDRKGEIAWHVNSVDPDIGILLNVGHVHGEQVGSIEDIYEEKKNLADYMERTGKPLVLNIDDERLVRIKDAYREGSELITFGKSEGAEYQILGVTVDEKGTHFSFKYYDNVMDVDLNVYGEGYVYNAMAAIISANRLGVAMDNCIKGVGLFEGGNGRFEKLRYGKNVEIVNDAYNANPTSMEMSLKTFNQLYSQSKYHRIVVLGDMKELGKVSAEKHMELGGTVMEYNFDDIYYVGDMFDSFNVGEHLESADEVAAMLNNRLDTLKGRDVAILLKASNSIKLYQVPDFLKKLGCV
jgi:UDP-N-acetylmuramoyl-tripeptide--D-alanyl-D-alanine ligase